MNRPRLKPRILLVDDNADRIETFRDWLASTEFVAIEASSDGRAMGVLRKGMTEGIAGHCLDHDIDNQPVTDTDLLLSGSHLIEAIVTSLPRSTPS
jgi:CheY-like chemotaxis protein